MHNHGGHWHSCSNRGPVHPLNSTIDSSCYTEASHPALALKKPIEPRGRPAFPLSTPLAAAPNAILAEIDNQRSYMPPPPCYFAVVYFWELPAVGIPFHRPSDNRRRGSSRLGGEKESKALTLAIVNWADWAHKIRSGK